MPEKKQYWSLILFSWCRNFVAICDFLIGIFPSVLISSRYHKYGSRLLVLETHSVDAASFKQNGLFRFAFVYFGSRLLSSLSGSSLEQIFVPISKSIFLKFEAPVTAQRQSTRLTNRGYG